MMAGGAGAPSRRATPRRPALAPTGVCALAAGAFALTGGLGGLGLRAAALLVERGATRVLLASRGGGAARLHSLGVKVLMGNLLAGGSMLDSGRASRRASGLDSPNAKAPAAAPAAEFDPRAI